MKTRRHRRRICSCSPDVGDCPCRRRKTYKRKHK